MKLSICISSYRNMPYLKQLIESFNSYDGKDVEFLLYDDFSDEQNTIDYLMDLDGSYFNIINASHKSGNPGYGRNIMMRIAKGEFIFFIDGDDLFIGDLKSLIYELLLCEDYDVILSYPKYVLEDGKLKDCDVKFAKQLYEVDKEIFKKYSHHYAIHQTGIWNIYKRKFLIDRNLEFPIDFRSEDHLFVHLILNEYPRIGRVKQRYYGWRLHEGSHSISGNVLENNLLFATEALSLYSQVKLKEIKNEIAYNLFNTLLSNLVRGYPKTSYKDRKKYFEQVKVHILKLKYDGNYADTDIYFTLWYKHNLRSYFVCNSLHIIYGIKSKLKSYTNV